jgi:hypothetical protein
MMLDATERAVVTEDGSFAELKVRARMRELASNSTLDMRMDVEPRQTLQAFYRTRRPTGYSWDFGKWS